MKLILILSPIILLTLLCSREAVSQVDTSNMYTRENAKTFVEKTAMRAYSGRSDRETFRNQMKVLAITVVLSIVGIALSEKVKDYRLLVLFIALVLNASLYFMDTFLLDLSVRELEFANRLDNYLLGWDKLLPVEVDSAVTDARRNVTSSNLYDKVSRAFTLRMYDQFWYAIPTVIILLVFDGVRRTLVISRAQSLSVLWGRNPQKPGRKSGHKRKAEV